jgi:hypothetical protein
MVVVATALVGCSVNSGTPPAGAAPIPSPTPSPPPPIELSGTNSKATDPIDIASGTYRVTWEATDTKPHGSSELFDVYIRGQQNVGGQEQTNLVHAVLPTTSKGETSLTSEGGPFVVSVVTQTATWRITFTWLSP